MEETPESRELELYIVNNKEGNKFRRMEKNY